MVTSEGVSMCCASYAPEKTPMQAQSHRYLTIRTARRGASLKKIALAALFVIGAIAAPAVGMHPTHVFAAGCPNGNCDNQWPDQTGCINTNTTGPPSQSLIRNSDGATIGYVTLFRGLAPPIPPI